MSGSSTKEQATSGSQPDPSAPTELRDPKPGAAETVAPGTDAQRIEPLSPDTIVGGDYRILSVVATEATSITYKAEDVNLGIVVLLKEFAPARLVARKPDGTFAARSPESSEDLALTRAHFVREAHTLVRLRHPSITRAHRLFESNATQYIVLEFDEGRSFDAWLSGLGSVPSQTEVDRLLAPLLDALASMHKAGYLHGDIQPASILVRNSGPPVFVNFAGACKMHDGHPEALPAHADAAFAAPEQIDGEAQRCGPWTDLYAMAATLYLAVTGSKPPASGVDRSALASARPGYRETFLKAIDRGLARDIAGRPQSVEEWDGIHPPVEEIEWLTDAAVEPTVVRNAPATKTLRRPQSGGTQPRTALADIATRVISAIPAIEDESDIPKYDFERWLVLAAIAAGLIGALLFATGMNFALAAVCQVAATALFFLRGYMPLSRYLSHTTRLTEAIVRRAEQVTRNAAWMIAAIMIVMTVNPLFVEWHVTSNTAVPLATLSAFFAIPALMMLSCGYFGMPVRWSLKSLAIGGANGFVVIFNILFFAAFVYTTASTPANAAIHPAIQVNRYLYIVATLAAGVLGVLIFLSRAAARQRIKQAAVSQ